jgi:hypothetical protein
MAIRRYYHEKSLITNNIVDLYPLYTGGSSMITIFGDDVIDSDLFVFDDITKLKGNDVGFFLKNRELKTELDKAPLYFKKSNGMFSGSPYQSNGTVYAPGRVIYERITDYKTYTLTDNSPIQDNKYRKFSNFTTNVFEVKFNWAIESTMPSGPHNYIKYENDSPPGYSKSII